MKATLVDVKAWLSTSPATASRPGWAGAPSPEGGLLRRSKLARRVRRPAARAAGVEGFAATTCGTLGPLAEVADVTEQGIQRVRSSDDLVVGLLAHSGLTLDDEPSN